MSDNARQGMTLERIAELRDRGPLRISNEDWRDLLSYAERAVAPATFTDAVLRCEITGNLCGTDTWAVGQPCKCKACRAWLTRWRATDPAPAIREARLCMKCGRTAVGWRYNRCPRCGQIDSGATPIDDPAPAEGAPQVYRCTRCNGLAEWQTDEKLWRHTGESHQKEYLEQGFCDRYGYPIDVAPGATPTPTPARATPQELREIANSIDRGIYTLETERAAKLRALADWMEAR